MSIFQQGLDMYRGMSKEIKEMDEEPRAVERGIKPDLKADLKLDLKPVAKRSDLDDLKAQAREKVDKDMQDGNSVQGVLENFKKFLSKDKRTKMINLCEKEDSGKVGYVSMIAFNRILKSMGFRLLFDQTKVKENIYKMLTIISRAEHSRQLSRQHDQNTKKLAV